VKNPAETGAIDDGGGRAGAIYGQVGGNAQLSATEDVRAGRHDDGVCAATSEAGIDGRIRIGRLDSLPQGAIAVGVQFIIGRRDSDTRGINGLRLAGEEQQECKDDSQDDGFTCSSSPVFVIKETI
jgi:hypothetical protein